MNVTFTGKTVIVTGAAHGFGRAISQAFAARGALVWACVNLLRATRLSMLNISEEAAMIRRRESGRGIA